MATILILDDQSTSRLILGELALSIADDITVQSFASPMEALEWAKKNPVDLVLTDFKMPHMDGAEFTQWLRQIPTCADIPVIVITGVEDKAVRYRALEAGATDFLTKPIDHHECRARCRNLLTLRRQQTLIKDRASWLERRVQEATREMMEREKETLLRLARAGEYRDEMTGNHVVRMGQYCRVIADQLGLSADDGDVLEQAGPLHDIGKVSVPDHILLKPDTLTPDERTVVETHATVGHEILRDSPSVYLQAASTIALHHHERYDGQGYPNGLRAEETPLFARVVAVADVFDALASRRPHKAAWSETRSLDYLTTERDKHFDADIVDAFLARIDDVRQIQTRFQDNLGENTG
ncbi:MAG: two-component system response regulator [Gammaproteobacteria bacterium]|nr:MAG: two-component system response regulator [Gammaproteobacteria bacterium]